MRQEIIEQERQRQQRQEESEAVADPSNAEDMDNANFLASLAPDLRQEILLTADEAFLQSLPPQILAEANVLRERVAAQSRDASRNRTESLAQPNISNAPGAAGTRATDAQSAARRRQRNGKLKVEIDRPNLIFVPKSAELLGPLLTRKFIESLFTLFYLLSPIKRNRMFQKLLVNLCRHPATRNMIIGIFTALLSNDNGEVTKMLASVDGEHSSTSESSFPPTTLIGTPPEIAKENLADSRNLGVLRRNNDAVSMATAAISLPRLLLRCSSSDIPPTVARRIVAVLHGITKSSPRVTVSMIQSDQGLTCLDRLLDLFKTRLYTTPKNLQDLLTLLETVVSPLSLLPKDDGEIDLSSDRITPGFEYVKVPRVIVSPERLHLLVNSLRLESCSDISFAKVNIISRRLSRIEGNRDCILGKIHCMPCFLLAHDASLTEILIFVGELASVAQVLGAAAIRDLKSVGVRLSSAAQLREKAAPTPDSEGTNEVFSSTEISTRELVTGAPSSAVSLSTSNSEIKFVRVLQTLQSLCNEFDHDSTGEEFSLLVQTLDLEPLWKELEICLHLVSVLEGVSSKVDIEEKDDSDELGNDNDMETEDPLTEKSGKKLQNSVAGLITRFLPAIEAFFIVNASSSSSSEENEEASEDKDDKNNRLVQFASKNKVLLNALLRSNSHLLEKGLKAMVQMPKCRPFLDFDVKRHWFKSQVRRLRQQASRRHGSLRLSLRRKHVFEDSFRAFIHRNAEELRGKLHITFQNEEGVDAGGLSREFFAILAKEMFNPNYALFMSTEDGCTFQPNPNSSINLDDCEYASVSLQCQCHIIYHSDHNIIICAI